MDYKGKIPSSIASKLEHVRQYMNINRVTAFVGAGFSLNAVIPGNATMKTWSQLRDVFLDKLYGDNDDKREDNSDVVRLASMVDAQYGHNELDCILEAALPDNLIRPGRLHEMMVKLPWKDILTTNYDTLLERAAQQTASSYTLVTNKETLLYKTSPRIIKLHGSFPNIHPYIMTQEDYRRYPADHPDMVNTARQCFLESLVCLIGFSGEDPNFRAWIGWLRDVIGIEKLCPTYLVTYKTEFHAAEKALLAQMGIDYINLAEINGIANFEEAYDFFLNYLKQKPLAWNGSINIREIDDKIKEPGYIEQKIKELESIRKSYPGWLILPKEHEKDFNDVNEGLYYYDKLINEISDNKCLLKFIYELDWRMSISATPKKFDSFIKALEKLNDNSGEEMSLSEKSMLESLQISLLAIYRHNHEPEKFELLCAKLQNADDCVQRAVCYERALFALARLDFESVQKILSNWNVDFGNYQNCIQKANLLIYLGNKKEAFELMTECMSIISKSLFQNKDDAHARSCIKFIVAALNQSSPNKNGQENDDILKLATGDSIGEISSRLSHSAYENETPQGYSNRHQFRLGYYSHSWHFGGSGYVKDFFYPCKWLLIKEQLGLPMYQTNDKFLEFSLSHLFEYSWNLAWNTMMMSASSSVIDKVLGREQLATIDMPLANQLFDELICQLEHVKQKYVDVQKSRIMNILPVTLGRLCTKVSEDRVLRYVKAILALDMPHVSKHLKYAYDCLTNNNLYIALDPLLSEKEIETEYNIGFPVPDRVFYNYHISENIVSRIIKGIKSEKLEAKVQALVCLDLIWPCQGLTENNKTSIATAIKEWRDVESPVEDALYTYSYIKADADEKNQLTQLAIKAVENFRETEYNYDTSSVPLSQWNDHLDKLILFSKLNCLTDDQKRRIMLHDFALIDKNKTVFERNDNYKCFGGIRKFTTEIIGSTSDFLCSMNLTIFTSNEIDQLKKHLSWIESAGYQCLSMKVKISINDEHELPADIESSLCKSLFSNNREIRNEAIAAFFTLYKLKGNVSRIIDYVFAALPVANCITYKNILILLKNLISAGYEENGFIEKSESFLNEMHQNYRSYGLDVVALADLQYYANYLAGVMSTKYKKYTKPVFGYDEARFNDVVIGYNKGTESIMLHKNTAVQ